MSGPNASPTAGGWRVGTARGVAGFFRVAQEEASGRWSLVDPDGRAFFCRAVHDVRGPGEPPDRGLPPDSVARLRGWGFNALGTGAEEAARGEGLPWMGTVEFLRAGPAIVAPGVRLPDVFDPDWGRRAAARAAEVCAPWAEERLLLGWVTDDRLAWGPVAESGEGAVRPGLLQVALSLEPSCAAYHAAWEFALALHGGRFEALVRAWGVALANKEAVRERTRAEAGLATRGYLRDEARWVREWARRYFTTTAAAIRAADPHHLVFGARLPGGTGPAVRAENGYPAVDVPLVDWRHLPAEKRDGAGDGAAAGPVLAGEVEWVSEEFQRLPTAARLLRLTSVEWMLRRGRAALERAVRHPAVTGYAWSRWQDEPGEQPPFGRGLVHVDGSEAREHTELLAQTNRRAEALRREGAAPMLSP